MCLASSMMAGEGWQKASWAGISWLVYACLGPRDRRQVRVPEQANGSTMDGGYEVSAKLSRSTDLRRIC